MIFQKPGSTDVFKSVMAGTRVKLTKLVKNAAEEFYLQKPKLAIICMKDSLKAVFGLDLVEWLNFVIKDNWF